MRVSAYLRVSSKAQTVDTQRAAIERCALARGDAIAEWYSERQSASTVRRPELDRLRADARSGQISRLYVYRIDRLTRSGIRDTLGLVQELRGAGCEIVTVADSFQLSGPESELILAILAWAAQVERSVIGQRIAAARLRIEAKGGKWGKAARLDPKTRALVQQMSQVEGRSVRQISAALKIPRSIIGRAVSRKVPPNGHPKNPGQEK